MPVRIQRKRTKGFKLPPGCVYVGRPTKFGNPYWDVERYGLDLCLTLFRESCSGGWNPSLVPTGPLADLWHQWLYRDHCTWLKRFDHHPSEVIRSELRGKDLACWCALDRPCHATILLAIANSCE